MANSPIPDRSSATLHVDPNGPYPRVSSQNPLPVTIIGSVEMNENDFKRSARATTTANITLSGTQTIDGVALVAGDRVLVKNQSAGAENGLWQVAAGAWSRTTDASVSAQVTAAMFVFIEEGTTQADTGWLLTTNNPIVLNTTPLVFGQIIPTTGQAPASAQYVVLVADATLTNERVLIPEASVLTVTDGGAGGPVTLGVAVNGITNAKLRQGAATSVIGRAAGSAGDVADIAASADGQVLRRASGVVSFGAVDLSDADAVSGALPITSGGTGQTSQTPAFDALAPTTTKGDLIVHNGSDNVRRAVGTNGQLLTADSAEATGVKWADPAAATFEQHGHTSITGQAVTALSTFTWQIPLDRSDYENGTAILHIPAAVANASNRRNTVLLRFTTTASQSASQASENVSIAQYPAGSLATVAQYKSYVQAIDSALSGNFFGAATIDALTRIQSARINGSNLEVVVQNQSALGATFTAELDWTVWKD